MWLEETACSPIVYNDLSIEIYKKFASSIFTMNKNTEVQAVYNALREVLMEKYSFIANQ